MTTALPSADEILAALAEDPLFPPDSAIYTRVRPFVVRLPEVIGPERLSRPVTCEGYECYQRQVVGWLMKDPDGYQLVDEAVNAIVDDEAGEYDSGSGFRPDVARRHQDGTLTYGDLLRLQPGALLPVLPK